jgi:phosphate transport system permease protein
MTFSILLFLVAGLGLIGWLVARVKAQKLNTGRGALHSRPGHHGWHMALWIMIPALLGLFGWNAISPGFVKAAILADPAAAALPMMEFERNAILSEAFALASNPDAPVFNPDAEKLVAL